MDNDEDYLRSLTQRIGPILARYTTSSQFSLPDLDVKEGRFETEIKARYGTDEDHSIYIEETLGKKAKGKEDRSTVIVDQKITVYLPDDFWDSEGKEMVEELRSKFIIAKDASVKVVVVNPYTGFRLEKLAK